MKFIFAAILTFSFWSQATVGRFECNAIKSAIDVTLEAHGAGPWLVSLYNPIYGTSYLNATIAKNDNPFEKYIIVAPGFKFTLNSSLTIHETPMRNMPYSATLITGRFSTNLSCRFF